MRKSLILTSILALAACSNGGGEHNPGYAHGAASTPTISAGATFTNGIYTNTATNSNVTQMRTQVVVDSGGHVIVPNLARGGSIRSGSIQDINGNTYNVYDLEDVQLRVAAEVPGSLKIGLTDDGAIKDITLASGGVESKLARDGDTNQFRGPIFEYVPSGSDRAEYRIVDGTDFGALAEIEGFGETLDENGHATMATLNLIASNQSLSAGGHWNYVDERMEVTTNKHITDGNSSAPVLRYSDFGHFNPVYRSKHTELDADVLTAIRTYGADIEAALVSGNDEQLATLLTTSGLNRSGKDKYRSNAELTAKLAEANYQLFAGGYAIGADGQPVAGGSFDAPLNATFTGTGVGRVYTSIHANANGTEQEYKDAILAQYGVTGDGHDITKSFTTSSATLTVDASGNQELEMVFPDFYRVTANKPVEGDTTVVLDNPNNIAIANQYRMNGDVALPDYTETPPRYQVTSNGTPGAPETAFMPGYYGVGSASEAAGLVRYADTVNNIDVKDTTEDVTKTFTREFEFQGAYGMKKN